MKVLRILGRVYKFLYSSIVGIITSFLFLIVSSLLFNILISRSIRGVVIFSGVSWFLFVVLITFFLVFLYHSKQGLLTRFSLIVANIFVFILLTVAVFGILWTFVFSNYRKERIKFLWQEEQQNRADTKYPYSERRKLWKERLEWPGSCETQYLETLASTDKLDWVWEYGLGNQEYFIIVLCHTGAYQGTSFLYTYDDFHKRKEQLSLPEIYTSDGKSYILSATSEVTGFIDYFPESKKLRVLTKSRGMGDCGRLSEYSLENNSYFVLEKVRGKKECDGSYVPEEQWPIIFDSKKL